MYRGHQGMDTQIFGSLIDLTTTAKMVYKTIVVSINNKMPGCFFILNTDYVVTMIRAITAQAATTSFPRKRKSSNTLFKLFNWDRTIETLCVFLDADYLVTMILVITVKTGMTSFPRKREWRIKFFLLFPLFSITNRSTCCSQKGNRRRMCWYTVPSPFLKGHLRPLLLVNPWVIQNYLSWQRL